MNKICLNQEGMHWIMVVLVEIGTCEVEIGSSSSQVYLRNIVAKGLKVISTPKSESYKQNGLVGGINTSNRVNAECVLTGYGRR